MGRKMPGNVAKRCASRTLLTGTHLWRSYWSRYGFAPEKRAGAMVTARRTTGGTRSRSKPRMTTWPAYVPTLEEDRPQAGSANANARADGHVHAVESGDAALTLDLPAERVAARQIRGVASDPRRVPHRAQPQGLPHIDRPGDRADVISSPNTHKSLE